MIRCKTEIVKSYFVWELVGVRYGRGVMRWVLAAAKVEENIEERGALERKLCGEGDGEWYGEDETQGSDQAENGFTIVDELEQF